MVETTAKKRSKWDEAPAFADPGFGAPQQQQQQDPGLSQVMGGMGVDMSQQQQMMGGAPMLGGAATAALQEAQRKAIADGSFDPLAPMTGSSQSMTSMMLARQQRHLELYVGNLMPNTTYETLVGFLAGLLAALTEALPDGAAKGLCDGAPITSGRCCAPVGITDTRNRTDHAFIECRDASVASTLAMFSGIPAVGIAAGAKGLRISRPKGYVAPPGGDKAAADVPLEVLRALGVDGNAHGDQQGMMMQQHMGYPQQQPQWDPNTGMMMMGGGPQQQQQQQQPPMNMMNGGAPPQWGGPGGPMPGMMPGMMPGGMPGGGAPMMGGPGAGPDGFNSAGHVAGNAPHPSYVCHRCGIGGHYVQDCPTIALGIPGIGVPPPGYVCHRCGVSGHYVQDCPQKLLHNAALLANSLAGGGQPGGAPVRRSSAHFTPQKRVRIFYVR